MNIKAQYAKAEQLGGVFVWSIDNDGMQRIRSGI